MSAPSPPPAPASATPAAEAPAAPPASSPSSSGSDAPSTAKSPSGRALPLSGIAILGIVLGVLLAAVETVRILILLMQSTAAPDSAVEGRYAVLSLFAFAFDALPFVIGALGAVLFGRGAGTVRLGGIVAMAAAAFMVLVPSGLNSLLLMASPPGDLYDPDASLLSTWYGAAAVGGMAMVLGALVGVAGHAVALVGTRAADDGAAPDAAPDARTRPLAITAIVLAALLVLSPVIAWLIVNVGDAVTSPLAPDSGFAVWQALGVVSRLPGAAVGITLMVVLGLLLRRSDAGARTRRGAMIALGGLVLASVLHAVSGQIEYLLGLTVRVGSSASEAAFRMIDILGAGLDVVAALVGGALIVIGAVIALKRR